MDHPQLEMTSSERLREGICLFGRIVFSSVLLLFLFWSFTTIKLLNALREKSASSAHLILVFENPPSVKEVSGLQAVLEKIAGPGSVVSLADSSSHPKNGGDMRSRRLLSVTISLGHNLDGQIVALSDQVHSIQSIVKNDSQISEVIFNPDWVSKVDEMAQISERIRVSLNVFLILLFSGIALYWGRISPSVMNGIVRTAVISAAPAPKDNRTPIFRRENISTGLTNNNTVELSRADLSESGFFGRIRSSAALGGVCGILAIFLAWTIRSMIYPAGMNPFQGNGMVLMKTVPFWMAFPFLTGLAGMLGGFVNAVLLPPSSGIATSK